VILEDLHWADPSTLDLISALARRREPAKLLLLGTYRPVDVVLSQSPLKTLKQDLLVRHLCHEIAMEGFEASDVADYLARIFAAENIPADLSQMIHQNSGGNPLFMAAIVQDMANKGLIAEDRGRLILTAPLEELYPGIPETLQRMLEIQFEQLSTDEQRVLQSGSVVGERFSVWAAAAMLDASPESIEELCDKLASRQRFIRSVGIHATPKSTPSAQYEFRHSIYRQALQRSLSDLNKSRLHLSLAERLKPICAAGKPEMASELALHFEEGRDYEQAACYWMLTAENLAMRFGQRESIQVLQHALELLRNLTPNARNELEIQILQRVGDSHYALGAISDSALAYETAATRAAEAGLREAQIGALAQLAIPAWYLDPARGNDICQQAISVSREHSDPLILAQTQLAAACFNLVYDAWREEDLQTCTAALRTIRRLSSADVPEDVLYAYVQTLQGNYHEALKQAETVMIATSNPAVHLLAAGAKILSLLTWGRFGDVLGMIRFGREAAKKNGEDSWMLVIVEAWLRALCFDFEGVRGLTALIMRSDGARHALQRGAIAMVATGCAELNRGNYGEALVYFRQVLDFQTTPRFFLHWHWRMQAQLGVTQAWLYAGDLDNAHREADAFLESALSTAEPNLRARAWEIKSRIARAEMDHQGAMEYIEKALAILNNFDIPVTAWHVHRTAADLFGDQGTHQKAGRQRTRAKELIMRIADSFEPGEPLREAFLSAPPIRRIFGEAISP
jgi:tetratricopeptide (TPR) repeat protein